MREALILSPLHRARTLDEGDCFLHSLVTTHPLVDGNKRLGWLATAVSLELNDVRVTQASNDEVYDLVIAVAGANHSVEDNATLMREVIVRRSTEGPRTHRAGAS